jgi:hypothetical protein
MKMFGEYILGWAGPSNKAADKGTIVHKVMEILASAKKAQQDGLPHFEDEVFGEVTSKVEKIKLDPLIDEVYDYYSTAFSHHKWAKADKRDCKKWAHEAVSYKNGAYDPRKSHIIRTEGKFDFPLPEEWAKYRYELVDGTILDGTIAAMGSIDFIREISKGVYEIVDWKTGSRVNWGKVGRPEKTYDDFLVDLQLRLYHLAVFKLFPEIEHLVVTVFYIKDGGPFTMFFEKNDIVGTLQQIREKIEIIKATTNPLRFKDIHRNVPLFKSPCAFCPLNKNTFEGTNVVPLTYSNGNFMNQCDQIHFALKHRPMDKVIQHMKKDGYDFTEYRNPGSI